MIKVSVLIATFNSQRTLERVLKSVRKQTFPRKNLEIIVVDGGSLDSTLTIAKKYRAKVIKNPMVEPMNAKYLGFLKARGKYLLALDHDEVLKNKKSIDKRIEIFRKDKRVKALHSSGYETPKELGWVNLYVNEFGDPFSFFIYNLTKDFRFFIPTLRTRYVVVNENSDYILFKVSSKGGRAPLMEVLAGGAMVDREYVLRKFKKLVPVKELFLPHLHLHLLSTSPYLAVVKSDVLYHHSAESFSKYIKKLEWRIKNNIYFRQTSGSAGFLKRETFENKGSDIKKYVFLVYSLSLIFPLIDAIRLGITRKTVYYLLHVPLTFLTGVLIIYHFLKKFFGFYPILTSYDGSTKILKKWT